MVYAGKQDNSLIKRHLNFGIKIVTLGLATFICSFIFIYILNCQLIWSNEKAILLQNSLQIEHTRRGKKAEGCVSYDSTISCPSEFCSPMLLRLAAT